MIKGLRSFNRDTGFEYKILSSIGSWGPTSLSPDYRSDRRPIAFTKFGSHRRSRPPGRGTKFRLASLTPDDAERWIDADANCSMIIYNVGGASVADHKHLKWIKGSERAQQKRNG